MATKIVAPLAIVGLDVGLVLGAGDPEAEPDGLGLGDPDAPFDGEADGAPIEMGGATGEDEVWPPLQAVNKIRAHDAANVSAARASF